MDGNAMLKPALWGALIIGVLSGLPFVSIGNCCCCAWVVSGGMVAAYLLQLNTPTPITPGDGALVGLLAGLFGAFVNLVVSVPMNVALGPLQQRLLQRILEMVPDMPEQSRQALENMGGSAVNVVGIVASFIMMLVIGAIFASLGGLLGAFFFKKKTPAVQPPAL